MSEHKNPDPSGKNSRSVRPDILLALIEHASRPVAYALVAMVFIIWLFIVREPLFKFAGGVTKVGAAGFVLERTVTELGLAPELRALRGLNDDQINLFLVIGRKRTHITYRGLEVTEANLSKLRDFELLSEFVVKPDGEFFWRVSDKGHRLHNILFSQILATIRAGNN